MKYLKWITLPVLFVLLAGCANTIPTGYPPNSQHSTGNPFTNDDYYDDRRRRDDNRDDVLRRRSDGDACKDEDRDHDCKDQCSDMYNRSDDKEDCERLDVEEIEKLFEAYQLLEKADLRDLEDINPDDLKDYLDLSIAGFDSLIREYKTSEAEDILLWIATDGNVAEIFEDADEDYRILEALLEKLSSFNSSQLDRPFTKDISRGTLFEEAIYNRNEDAARWFLDYVFYRASACNNNEQVSSGCFTVICKIGDGFEDEDLLREWLEFSSFENYMDDIIRGGINAGTDPKWDATAVTGPSVLYDDRDNTWVETLCGGLI